MIDGNFSQGEWVARGGLVVDCGAVVNRWVVGNISTLDEHIISSSEIGAEVKTHFVTAHAIVVFNLHEVLHKRLCGADVAANGEPHRQQIYDMSQADRETISHEKSCVGRNYSCMCCSGRPPNKTNPRWAIRELSNPFGIMNVTKIWCEFDRGLVRRADAGRIQL